MNTWSKNLFAKFFSLITILPLFWSCEQATSQGRPVDATSIEPQAQIEEGEAINYIEVKRRLYMDKDEALQDFRKALSALELKIEKLESKITQKNPEIGHNIKEVWKEDAEILRLQRDKLLSEFKKLEDSTPENWEKLQASFCDRWAALKETWNGKQAE